MLKTLFYFFASHYLAIIFHNNFMKHHKSIPEVPMYRRQRSAK